MKILVVHESGEQRLLELDGPRLSVHEGDYLNCVRDGGSVEHWFTKAGYYDGWGVNIALPSPPVSA